jgi:hypothetical protein
MNELKSTSEYKPIVSLEKTIKKGKITKRICVDQVENGFIISISKWGNDESGNYVDECKKFISATNPFEMKPKSSNKNLLEVIKSM